MLTVKEFKDLGGKTSNGDEVKDEAGYVGKLMCCGIFNESDTYDSDIIVSFAWRPLNTLPNNPKFKCEVDKGGHNWRPLLDQSATKPVNGVAVKPNDDKPVFTQEMADIKRELSLHKANSELLVTLTKFMVENNIGNAGESCIDVAIRELSEKHNIDTRTPKQKAVDELADSILGSPMDLGNKGLANYIINLGYELKC